VDELQWDPEASRLDAAPFSECRAIFHLAGESVGAGLWSEARKRRILDSRVRGSRLVAEALAQISAAPTLIQASAIGFYGDAGERWCRESDPAGEGFLAGVVCDWEGALRPAAAAGSRVVLARIGLVIGAGGGVLERILPIFKIALGGRIGDGTQYMSWITRDDLVSALLHLVEAESVSGPVNLVSPGPVTNAEFTAVLGRVLARPTLLPLPAFAVRTLMGQMGRELLLFGARVSCDRLTDTGFSFRYPELELALKGVLSRET